MKTICAVAIFGLGMGLPVATVAASDANSEDSATAFAEQVCNVCHGPGGRSPNSAIPNLAAQSRAYLVAKMRLFRDRSLSKSPSHLEVLGLALLDDPGAEAIARYYARQAPAKAIGGDAAAIAEGDKIFVRGIREQNIPACAVCHGANAQGRWIFPRLAGQHAEYLERQMEQIQREFRDAPVMHGILKTMTPDQIKELAAYAQAK